MDRFVVRTSQVRSANNLRQPQLLSETDSHMLSSFTQINHIQCRQTTTCVHMTYRLKTLRFGQNIANFRDTKPNNDLISIKHRAGQCCFELLALIGSPQLSNVADLISIGMINFAGWNILWKKMQRFALHVISLEDALMILKKQHLLPVALGAGKEQSETKTKVWKCTILVLLIFVL